MNSAAKFQNFKQSLASVGRSSQAKDQIHNPLTSLPVPTIQEVPMQTNPSISHTATYMGTKINPTNSFIQQIPQKPISGFHSKIPNQPNETLPKTLPYQSMLDNNNKQQIGNTSPRRSDYYNHDSIPMNKVTEPSFLRINSPSKNMSDVFNVRQSTMNKGAIRSAMKFNYELGGFKLSSGSGSKKASEIKQAIQKPAMNVFSCMDNPSYQREFEMSPKIMHK